MAATPPLPPTDDQADAGPAYVQRDAQGRIVTLTRQALSAQLISRDGWQAVNGSEPDVLTFVHALTEQANPLSSSDAGLARVTEDLIDILLNRNVIQFTDLPDAVQTKLLQRRRTRASLSQRLHLLAEDGDHGVL